MARRKLPRALFSSVSATALDPSEILFDQTNNVARLGDGVTAGGRVLMNGILSGGVTVPLLTLPYDSPSIDGGLIGENDTISKSAKKDILTLSGTRTKAQIAHTIQLLDDQTGPESGPSTFTPQSASYGLSIFGIRPNWNTSGKTGEMDAINVFLRQANSDAASILSNVGTRSGFGCFAETYTFSADSSGAVIKAINTSIGVVNSRDGGEYGFNVQSNAGTGLTAAFRAAHNPGSSFTDWFQGVDESGNVLARIRAADGAYIGGSLTPRVDGGAQIGAPTLRYANVYAIGYSQSVLTFADLASRTPPAGMTAHYVISDCNTATFGAAAAGGGSNIIPVFWNGSSWRVG